MATGNLCLFYLFQLLNLAVILGSAGEIIASSFVLHACGVQWSVVGFLSVGGTSLVLGLIGLGLRRSANFLFFYIALLLMAAAVEAGFALAALFLANYSSCLDSRYANPYPLVLLGFSPVQLLSAVLGWFYRESLCNAEYEKEAPPIIPSVKSSNSQGHYARLKGNYNR